MLPGVRDHRRHDFVPRARPRRFSCAWQRSARIEKIDVPITDPARTIVDCFRYRTKVGLDVAMEGLRQGLHRRRCTPDDLWRHARTARVWSVMRPYVEAMVADAA